MQTDDAKLAQALRRDFPDDSQAPSFDKTWAAAEARYRRSRRRYAGFAAAAVAVAAVFAVLSLGQEPQDTESWVGDELLSSTSWSAPSDVLMPQREFDIYQELPSLTTSTKSMDGALL